MERERVCREIQPEDIDFGDPHIASTERDIPENWNLPYQRTNLARQVHPIRECLFTKDPTKCGLTTDLTTAQMFIQGNRLPRTPPRNSSPRMPESTNFYHSIEDRESHDIIQDFRDVRAVIHDWSPRKLWLLHQGLNYYQSRQYCLYALSSLCWRRRRHHLPLPSMCSTTPTRTTRSLSQITSPMLVWQTFLPKWTIDHWTSWPWIRSTWRTSESPIYSVPPQSSSKKFSADRYFLPIWHRAKPKTLLPVDSLLVVSLLCFFLPKRCRESFRTAAILSFEDPFTHRSSGCTADRIDDGNPEAHPDMPVLMTAGHVPAADHLDKDDVNLSPHPGLRSIKLSGKTFGRFRHIGSLLQTCWTTTQCMACRSLVESSVPALHGH